jgi:hypothetical protein
LNLNIYYFFNTNKCKNNFLSFINEIKQKEILIIEIKNKHGECIPGYIKYFSILGYRNIEILITRELYNQNILDFNHFKLKVNFLIFSHREIDKFISLGMCDFYKICFFNTLDIGMLKMRKYLQSKHKFKSILVLHNKKNLKKFDIYYNNIVVLKKFKNNFPFYEINPHYFGEYGYHIKSNITNFVTAGNFLKQKKNFNILINSANKLISNNIFNFHITIIGNGYKKLINLVLKKKLTKYITFTGRISYSLMYKYISKNDFFLPLLDPNIHKHYLKYLTTGSFQLSYGFNIPLIIEKTFADAYKFNNNNSIVYNKNEDFYYKLKEAININKEKYEQIKNGLKIKTKKIEINSIYNLKKILNK